MLKRLFSKDFIITKKGKIVSPRIDFDNIKGVWVQIIFINDAFESDYSTTQYAP